MKTPLSLLCIRFLPAAILAACLTLGVGSHLLAATSSTNSPTLVMNKAATNSAPEAVPASPTPPAMPTTTADKPGHSMSIIVGSDADVDKADPDGARHSDGGHTDVRMTPERSVFSEFESDLVPIVAIVATFGTPVLIVFCVSYFKYRRRSENLALAREYLSKGMPVPSELLDSSVTADMVGAAVGARWDRSCSDVRKGFRLLFIGLGISIALYINEPHSTSWGWGLIPAVMGLGFVISGWVEKRQAGNLNDPRQQFPGKPL